MAFTKAQEKEIKRLQGLGFSEKEATEMVAYDDIVEHSKTAEFDLTEEQQKVAKKYTDIGSKKKNPNYTFTKRERKPNETKRTIMQWLKILFEGFELKGDVSNVNLSNIERQIDFECEGKQFSITLTEHRAKKE